MVAEENFDLDAIRGSGRSQEHEDAILAELFRRKAVEAGYFVEFGAWDGQHLSNTFALYEKGWVGCYIEGSPARYADLTRNITRPGMALVEAFVGTTGPNSLNALLERSVPAGRPVDLMSIDIDSDDLAVWRSLDYVRPRVVIIEFNPTIPFDVRYENPAGKNRGNSLLSIWEYGISIGYEPIAATSANLILIDRDFNAGAFRTLRYEDLIGRGGLRFFFGYDGTLMRYDAESGTSIDPEFHIVPWAGSMFPQPLPKPFRRFDPGSRLTALRRYSALASSAARRPLSVVKGLLRRQVR